MRTLLPVLGLFAVVAVSSPISAQALPPAQNLDQLEAMVIGTLGAGVGMPGGLLAPIDRRMRLAACGSGIQIDPPTAGSVTVRCTTLGWRLRVPLMRNNSSYGNANLTMGMGDAGASNAGSNAAIRRGDPVTLVAQGSSYSISVEATAMEDANVGSRVRVATASKGSTLFAEVLEAGKVRLIGFK